MTQIKGKTAITAVLLQMVPRSMTMRMVMQPGDDLHRSAEA
jgi:hypothetical protein